MSAVPPSAPLPEGAVCCRPKAEYEAFRLADDTDWQAVTAWCDGQYVPAVSAAAAEVYPEARQRISVRQDQGGFRGAYEGDWIVRKGPFAFEVCNPAEFAERYEVTEAVTSQ